MIRIVKMTFREEEIEAFKTLFDTVKDKILQQKGCQHLELWQSNSQKNILFTYSIWDHIDSLNAYRNSDFFENTWKQTKSKFADKPEAWSVEKLFMQSNNKSSSYQF
jgi:quinol monooxygenase YgiN